MQGEKQLARRSRGGAGGLGTIRGICQGLVDRCVGAFEINFYVSCQSFMYVLCWWEKQRHAGLQAEKQQK